MSLMPSRNYAHNKKIPLPAALINGQSLGAVSAMRYGLSSISYSGCEVIAVYNALFLLGRPQPFPDVARYMERFRVLLGFWGTNFLSLGRCLRHFGLSAKRVRRPASLKAALAEGHICLYVYWVGKRFRSPVHTVCIRASSTDAERVVVCNAYNNCGHAVRLPVRDYISRHMIFGYVIEKDSGEAAAEA